MLFGDLVMAVREAATDNPPVMGPPTLSSAFAASVTESNLPLGTYFCVLTALTPWGESLPSNEVQVTLNTPGENAIAVVWSFGSIGINPSMITHLRLYVGTTSGGETVFYDTANPNSQSGSTTFNFFIGGPFSTPGSPPTRSTAYLPDQDGDAVSAATIFRWITDGLKSASQVAGGLLDYGGVSTIAGQPQYIVPGLWKRIASLWYDGYPLSMDDNGNYFRRNSITASILSSVATSTFNNQMMIEVWPQPARTAAATTLSAQMNVSDTQAQVGSTSGFLLNQGFAIIGGEIVSYSGFTGTTLQNLQRALGGTVSIPVYPGAAVKELNMFWSGWRMYNPSFVPGQAFQTVPVPVGWESFMQEYALGRMKLAEQNVGDYSKLTESFNKNISDWFRSNKVTTGPRQVGDVSNGLEVVANLGGGWVIP